MAVFLFGRGTPVKTNPVLSANSWEQIAKACQRNEVPDTWEIGDYKNMTIDGEEYLVTIIGKNHDTYSDGTGTAPLTFQLKDCYKTSYRYDDARSNRSGWRDSEIRTVTLPALMALMPSEIQPYIREVNKKTSAGGLSSTIITTADKLFLLAEDEAVGRIYSAPGEGSRYPYYLETIRRIKNQPVYPAYWLLRSPNDENDVTVCEVRSEGNAATNYADSTSGISFAFCF